MFWEGEFQDGSAFELELKYGTVILSVLKNEFVIGHVSDFPDVADVILVLENWVLQNSNELERLE